MGVEYNVYRHGDYSMTTASNCSSFIVWHDRIIGKPVKSGTIMRPRTYSRDGWVAYDMAGTKLGRGIGPRTALACFTRRDREAALTIGTED